MANSVVQTIREAEIDARSLSEFISKDASFTVTRRLAPTIHTLDYYLLVLNNVKDKGDLADIAISDTLDKLEQLEPTVIQRVEDAINNTAVEGGVLADTFVTATANGADRVARTQRDINDERTSIKDFGNYGDGGDWTPALEKIVGKGIKVWLPDGHYQFRTDGLNCLGKDLVFEGDNAVVELIQGSSDAVFDVSDCNVVSFKGIEFTSSVLRVLLKVREDSYLESVEFRNNTFKGSPSIIRAKGSEDINPLETPYGIREMYLVNNRAVNQRVTFFQLVDFPVGRGYFNDNTVHNLSHNFIYCAITNGSDNESHLKNYSYFEIKRNTLTTDDDFWSPASSAYHTFALIEGLSVEYTDNTISGMKCKSGAVVYDAYLSCMKVVSKNNIYRNIASFSQNSSGSPLIKAKQDSIVGLTATKIFDSNTYVVEQEWLTRIGETESRHKLFGIGIGNAGDVRITNLTVDVDTLVGDDPYFVESLHIENLVVSAKRSTGGTMFRPTPAPGGARFLNLKNISCYLGEAAGINLIQQHTERQDKFNKVMLSNVYLSTSSGSTPVSFLGYLRATSAIIEGVLLDCSVLRDLYYCVFDNLKISNFITNSPTTFAIHDRTVYTGRSRLNMTYMERANTYYMYLPITLDEQSLSYTVRIFEDNPNGEAIFSCNYTLVKQPDGSINIDFIDTEDTQRSIPLLSTESGQILPKYDQEGTPSVTIYPRLYPGTNPFVRFFGVNNLEGVVRLSIHTHPE